MHILHPETNGAGFLRQSRQENCTDSEFKLYTVLDKIDKEWDIPILDSCDDMNTKGSKEPYRVMGAVSFPSKILSIRPTPVPVMGRPCH